MYKRGETSMKQVLSRLPISVRAEIKRYRVERPRMPLPEDRDEFLSTVLAEHKVDAEQHYNELLRLNEDAERSWRVIDGSANRVPRTPYFLSIEQVATRWNVSSRTVWRMVRDGRLPSTMIGASRRIREEDVEKVETDSMVVS